MDKTMKCDVLVIGGGIAACFAAIKAAEAGADVIMADKGYVGRSGQSPYADSFLVFDPNTQDIEAAMEEINRHSEYLNNRFWTRTVLEQSAARYQDLLNWGCQFTGEPNTVPGAPPSGVQFDKTKGAYGEVLRRQCRKSGVKIVDQVMLVDFLKQDGRIAGAVGLPSDSTELVTFIAKTVISCVGACGYKPNGYPALMQLTGDGEAMAYRAGAAILGKEFVDAHYS